MTRPPGVLAEEFQRLVHDAVDGFAPPHPPMELMRQRAIHRRRARLAVFATAAAVVIAAVVVPLALTAGGSPQGVGLPSTIGRRHHQPALVPPPSWSGLRAKLSVPNVGPRSHVIHPMVTLINTTSKPITLASCPTYTLTTTVFGPNGYTVDGVSPTLPCSQPPQVIPPNGHAVIVLPAARLGLDRSKVSVHGGRLTARFVIAGMPAAVAHARVAASSPTPSAGTAACRHYASSHSFLGAVSAVDSNGVVTITGHQVHVTCGGADDLQYNPSPATLQFVLAPSATVRQLYFGNNGPATRVITPSDLPGYLDQDVNGKIFRYVGPSTAITTLTELYHP